MAEVGSAFVSVLPSARGFGKSLDRQVGPDLDRSGKAGGKRFGSAFGSTLKSALAPALAVVGVAAVGGLLKGAISEASDLNETLNKSSVIFGKNARSIERFGDVAAKSLGLSKNEAIAAAANFGDMFSQLGFGRNQAASMSKSVVKLSADLGSFNNLGTEDVADRISAAFRGEYDSLQLLIPNINAARVEQVALATTGKKTTKELTAQEKAAAVLAIVHKDGARAVGDFARTSGGLANQQKILSAQVTDLKAKIGTALLPIMAKLATHLNNKVVPAVSQFVGEMQDGTGTGGHVVDILKDVAREAANVGRTVGKIIGIFAGLPGSAQKVLLLAGAALILKNRFGDSIPTLQSFSREGAIATAKTVALRGSALAAGAGLAVLATKAGGANTALGGLATIGAGVATGFAVGGPWGAAIGGGAAALGVFASRSQNAAAQQAKVEAGAARAAATLNQQTGALTKLSRATFAQSLADSGAFTAARKVGASYKDVLNAALGNEAAMKRVNAANDAYLKGAPKAGEAAVKMRNNVKTLSDAIGANSSELAKQRNRISQVNDALDEAGKKHPKLTVLLNTSEFTASLKYVIASMNRIGKLSATAKANLHASDVGNNAKGTNDWRGGLTWVGEDGPELINLAKHAQVIPNHKIGEVSGSRGAAGSMDSLSPHAIRAALDGMSMDVRLTGGDRAKAQFVQEGIRAGARL